MKYWAFLSYSHTDTKWGDWLHKALETYRVPRRLVGKESRDGKIPERLFPIFRDREELPVSADLGKNVNEALEQSRYLIVICSPRSAQSRWVGEEIRAFKKLGREDRILALIVDGEPNASDGKPGFKVEDECFHETMRYRMVDGEISEIRSEPIAADAREGKDGKTNAKLKLLAGLVGVNYDDLKQREQERRLRRARIIVALSVALIGIFAALSVALFFKEREATRARDEATFSRDEARATLSRSDFLQALRSIDEGKSLDALAQLVRSLRFDPKNQAALCRLATLLGYRNYAIPIATTGEASPDAFKPDDYATTDSDFTSDGKYIAGLAYGTVRVWDRATGKLVTDSIKPAGEILKLKFSPDNKRILTVGLVGEKIGAAQVWDVTSPANHTELIKLGSPFPLVGFSRDGKRVVIASRDGAFVWNVQVGKSLCQPMTHGSTVTSVQFSPDGNRIVTASTDKTAQVWDVATATQPIQPMAHDQEVLSARFSPDGKRIVTASGPLEVRGKVPSEARVWDAQTGNPVTGPMRHQDAVWSVEFSPDGNRIVTASRDRTARVWDAVSGLPVTNEIPADSAKFSPDGKRILTTRENEARVWDAQTGDPVTEPMKAVVVGMARIKLAEFFSRMQRIVTLSRGGTLRTWDGQTGKPLSESTRIPTNTSIDRAELDPQGKHIVEGMHWGTVQVWDVSTGQPLTEAMPSGGNVSIAKYNVDGERILTAAEDERGEKARVWDAHTGKPLTDWFAYGDEVKSAQFSPDGTRIATAAGDEARIWDIAPANKSFPKWLLRLADAVAGEHLNDQGGFEPLSEDSAQILKEIKEQLNREPANNDWAIWGRWFLADRSTRTISPFSKITVPEYIENRIKENTPESLEEAEQLAVGSPELLKRIQLAKESLPPTTTEKEQEEKQ